MKRSTLIPWFFLLAGLSGFAIMATLVVLGIGGDIDRTVFLALRNDETPLDPWGPAWFEEAVGDVTALGSYTLLITTVSVSAVLLFINHHLRLAWLAIAAPAGGSALSSGLKLLFARDRPDLVDHMDRVFTASFPSGHATLSAVVWLTLALIAASLLTRLAARVWLLCAAIVLTFAVGASRVYLGVHWPSDVIAGWSLGIAWASLCWLVARRRA